MIELYASCSALIFT